MIDKRQFGIVIIAFRLFTCYAAISTELVEEWGCYDSEFKLTCNDIDSKVGILEATFTPHCENQTGNQKCLYYDEDSIMKIIAQSLSRKADTYEEEYAARKLLDVLRNARLREQEHSETEEAEAITSEYRSEFLHSTAVYDPSTINENAENVSLDYDVGTRSDKRIIRDSLEKLISLYLTKLKEDSIEYNLDDNHVRHRRDLSSTLPQKRSKLEPGKCTTMRRRVGTLDRIELEGALRNLTNTEFNIRKLLNYRCSGKNHCSFIFSNDHPYSTFWDEGTVHIKYICMDNFRVNKYCGELLQVGNEDWDLRKNINWTEIIKNKKDDEEEDEIELNGPRTSALRQNEMNFYQVKSVKIIKAAKNETPTAAPQAINQQNSTKLNLKISKPVEREKDKTKSKVYSQDFRLLKILPNEKPALEIEKSMKKEDEIELKKQTELEELITHQIDAAIETNEIDSVLLTTTTKPQTTKFTSSIISPTLDIFTTATAIGSNEEITITQKVNTEQSATIIVTDDDVMITEYKDLEKTVTQHATLDMDIQTDIIDVTKSDDDIVLVNDTILSIDSPEKGKYGKDEEKSSEKSDSYEDYDEEEDQKPTNVKHKAHQHTLPSSTLLHGFIANPGYPSYYIGSDRDCKWKIIIAKGQKMMLTILDLHLRVDEYCKDSLEIIDLENKKSLWRGCSELTRPIQLQSLSHQIEIVLKTKSKNIYPKRGFLIHYKAIGCVVPQIPEHVKLVNRLENLLRYNCEENHVFPDTSQSDRTLICINESWNDTLTKCVAVHETLGRHISLVNEQLRREGAKMTAENDMLSDILVPVFIISGLFILNAIVFIIILRYRKHRRDDNFDRELAEL
ncbi:unnamed protein product [Chironomus riparius]|uniref:CUB domain-containing protein n=1 Tax=Chironomus riparius TaxID=315576 RepID=A0A9N9RXB2_9DIPT|nr:unnamed protein product [Chironomus riparius]